MIDEEQRQNDSGDDYEAYMEYVQLNADPGDRLICNGDDLVCACEDGYLRDEFERSQK